MILAAAVTAASALGGFALLLILLIGLIVGVVWMAFPFEVNSALNRVQKLLSKQNEVLEKLNARQNETNKALQFLVDNWRPRP